jgi:hypothetical protein
MIVYDFCLNECKGYVVGWNMIIWIDYVLNDYNLINYMTLAFIEQGSRKTIKNFDLNVTN